MSDSTSAMPNGFDILKKMWEAFSPPATFTSPLTQLMQSAAPLLDPDEIENRIAEMRAVEQWLTLNLNVLRSTIQAFEVQRATYATLRAFGSGNYGTPGGAEAGTTSRPESAPQGGAAFMSPFGQAGAANFWRSPFASAEPAQDVASQARAPEPEPEPEPESEPEAAPAAENAPPEGGDAQSPFAQAGNAYGALDPSLWFNAMRAQFDQIAAAAQAAGMSAAQMTEAAAAQMSEAATKATQTAQTRPAGSGAAQASAKAPGKADTSDRSNTTAKRAAGATKTAGKTAAKRAPASKKTPTKSAAAKTSAKTSAKTPAKPARKATGTTVGTATDTTTEKPAPAAGKTSGKQSAWKW